MQFLLMAFPVISTVAQGTRSSDHQKDYLKPMHMPQFHAKHLGRAGPATATRRCSAPRRATTSAPSPCSCRRWWRRAPAAGLPHLPGTLTLHLPPAAPPTLSAGPRRAARVPAEARRSSGAACLLRTRRLGSNVRLLLPASVLLHYLSHKRGEGVWALAQSAHHAWTL